MPIKIMVYDVDEFFVCLWNLCASMTDDTYVDFPFMQTTYATLHMTGYRIPAYQYSW